MRPLDVADRKIIALSMVLFLLSLLIEFIAMHLFGGSFADLCAWDCEWYAGIINGGYHPQSRVHDFAEAANWAFFPLFPLIGGAVSRVFDLPAEMALPITGKVIYFLAIMAFIKFCTTYVPRVNPLICGLVLVLNPYAIYAHTGYTEPLYLLLTCLSLIFLYRGQPILAGIFGGALSGVRAVGVVLLFPYTLVNLKRFFIHHEERLNIALGFMLIPLGLTLFMTYLHYTMGDAMAFSHIQRAWDRSLQNPLRVLIDSIGPNRIYMIYQFNLVIATALIIKLLWNRTPELALFSVISILIPLSTGVWSLPRYIWWQAPILLAAAQVLQRRWLAMMMLPLMLAGLLFMYRGWFGGEWFVI